MYLTLLTQRELESLPEVTSTKPYTKQRLFHPDGLYSEQIFGPVHDYQCQCRCFIGKLYDGKVCPKCKVKVTSSISRFHNFGQITLYLRLVHPYAISLLGKEFGQSKIKAVIAGKKYFKIVNKQLIECDEETEDGNTGSQFLYDNISKLDFKDAKLKKFVKSHKDEIFPKHIPVLPVGTRNMLKVDNFTVVDDINNVYVRILKKNEASQKVAVFDRSLLAEYYSMQGLLQELFAKIEEKLSKKKGLIRQNLLGKRADFSSRGVIVPNPTLALDSVELPLAMCKELYKFHVLSYLINKKQMSSLAAFHLLDKLPEKEHIEILTDIMQTSCVILNRQPTLHRLGMIAFKPKIKKDSLAIAIPVLTCPPFNADFDGDQMAVYLPLSEAAVEESRTSLLATKQIISPSSRDVAFLPGHDIILGLYKLTKSDPGTAISELDPKTNIKDLLKLDFSLSVTYRDTVTTVGRVVFNKLIKEKLPLVNEPITKRRLYTLLREEKLRPWLPQILEDIKKIGFEITTQTGSSFSVGDFILKEATKQKKGIKDVRDMQKIEKLEDVMKAEVAKNPVFDMIVSGARGSWDQVRQIAVCKGFLTDVEGKIQPEPVNHALVEGLTPQEFFRSSFGSRKGVVDTSLNTGESGYLTRKLVFALSPCVVNSELNDCGSQRFFKIKITKDIAHFLKSRYIKESTGLTQVIDPLPYIGKTVMLRSPIFCESTSGFCKCCTGDFPWGREIGILAAQAMGEKTTQMTLRTFHTGGIATSAFGETLEKLNHPLLELEDDVVLAKKDGSISVVTGDEDDEASLDIVVIKLGTQIITFEKSPEIQLFRVGSFIDGAPILQINLKNTDIVSDLKQLRLLLDNKQIAKTFVGRRYTKLFTELTEIYERHGLIDFVYFEVLLSQLLYNNDTLLRFTREERCDDVRTLSSLPLTTSIIQGLSFERFKEAVTCSLRKIIDGSHSPHQLPTILEKILLLKF